MPSSRIPLINASAMLPPPIQNRSCSHLSPKQCRAYPHHGCALFNCNAKVMDMPIESSGTLMPCRSASSRSSRKPSGNTARDCFRVGIIGGMVINPSSRRIRHCPIWRRSGSRSCSATPSLLSSARASPRPEHAAPCRSSQPDEQVHRQAQGIDRNG